MQLLNSFREYIAAERLFSRQDKLLLAVSGGLDSVVLCELARQAGLEFSIAHANFQLRGAESDRDEQFVRDVAARYDRAIVVRRFDTAAFAAGHKLSIQVAARGLRYDWFRQVISEWEGGGVIVTAHQLDDNIETLTMNFFKGTGIAGLRGMLPRHGDLARPLLFARRSDLEKFAAESGLQWIEDSSNVSDKYTRNFFRHQVLPLIEKAYPAALDNLGDNLHRFREIETIYRDAIGRQKKKLFEPKGAEMHIAVLKLQQSTPLRTLIFELFSPYGFTPQQTGPIAALLDGPTGKYVCSPTHRLLRNRRWLILSPLYDASAVTILIEPGETKVEYPGGILRLEACPVTGGLPPADADMACLDAGEITWPLLLRPWRAGDYFYPLGMRKKKKLARFFIDQKLSLADKEKVWVLEMNKKIIWVVGQRIDDRFKLTAATRQMLRITAALRTAGDSAH